MHSLKQGGEELKLLGRKILERLAIDVLEVFSTLKCGISASFGDPYLVESRVGAFTAFSTLDIAVAFKLFESYGNSGGADVEMLCQILLGGGGLTSRQIHKHTVSRAVHACVGCPLLDDLAVKNIGGNKGAYRTLDRRRVSIGIVYDMFFFFSQFLLSPFARDKTVNALTVNYLIISLK